MYAQLCKRLSEEAPNFEPPNSPCTFRLLLLNKCRTEFENRSKASEAFEHRDGPLAPEEEERRQLTKRKMLGNIKVCMFLSKYTLPVLRILLYISSDKRTQVGETTLIWIQFYGVAVNLGLRDHNVTVDTTTNCLFVQVSIPLLFTVTSCV